MIQNRKHYTCATHSSLLADRFHCNGWSFHIYMMPLWDFVPEWHSQPGTRTGVHSRWGDSCQHDILWWYHVDKYRAMRGNRCELTPVRKSPRCHVSTPFIIILKLHDNYDQHHNLIFITLNIIYLATCQDMVPSTHPIRLGETWSMTSWVSQQLKDLYMSEHPKKLVQCGLTIIFPVDQLIHLKISSYFCENNLFN